MTERHDDKKQPQIVLVYSGILIPDDSPLLNDEKWLKGVIGSRSEDDADYGRPLLMLALDPELTDQDAIDYIKGRSAPSATLPPAVKALIEAVDDFCAARRELSWHSSAMVTAANEISRAWDTYERSASTDGGTDK